MNYGQLPCVRSSFVNLSNKLQRQEHELTTHITHTCGRQQLLLLLFINYDFAMPKSTSALSELRAKI